MDIPKLGPGERYELWGTVDGKGACPFAYCETPGEVRRLRRVLGEVVVRVGKRPPRPGHDPSR